MMSWFRRAPVPSKRGRPHGSAPYRAEGFGYSKLIGRALAVAIASTIAVVLCTVATLYVTARTIDPPPLAAADRLSTTVLDRHGQLLRAFTTADGLWRLPVEPADVDRRYLQLLMAFEDRRFRQHIGVDPLAMMRAAWQLVGHRRIVSGGSTLTMQVARLLDAEHERTAPGKLRQIVRALQLERAMGKDDILRLYLRLAPFGGNLEGVRAASLAYFGKEPRRLSVAEAALLVALPQSPAARRPDRFPAAARKARDRVLARALAVGAITQADAARARRAPVPTRRIEFPKLAPHLAEAEVARRPKVRTHRLTVDRDLQASLEDLARSQARARGDSLSAAILALDHTTGEVIAHVGSSDYFDTRRLGAIDMTSAVRSPGSTLKPVIYGLGFEAGRAHPEMLIEDRAVRFGSYAPKNFDDDFHGTVTIRQALATSLNIPAVKVLDAVGPQRLLSRLKRIGLDPVLPGNGEATLAIALGGLGLRLSDLASLYAALARGGTSVDITHVLRDAPGKANANSPAGTSALPAQAKRLLSPAAAWYVTDILKDAPPPASARGGRIAYKTGTSYGYRDAWAVGYDGRHTVAVWIGRADGSSTPGLTGHGAAAPILFDAFQRIAPARTAFLAAPLGALRATGPSLPPPLKRFREPGSDALAGPFLDPPVQIAFPPDRSELEAPEPDLPLILKAEGGALPLVWMVDDKPVATAPHARSFEWQPSSRGFVRLSVIDAKGRVDRVTVRIR